MKALLAEALRGLLSRRASTLVAVGGLMLALTACVLVAMLAIALSRPDPSIPDPERTVVLDMKPNPPGRPGQWLKRAPVFLGTLLEQRGVPLERISRARANGLDIRNGARLQPAMLILADPDV